MAEFMLKFEFRDFQDGLFLLAANGAQLVIRSSVCKKAEIFAGLL
jgi:hypothetical protein